MWVFLRVFFVNDEGLRLIEIANAPTQRELLLDLFHIICDNSHEASGSLKAPVNSTLLLAFLALMTEIGPSVVSVTSQMCKIVHGLAPMLGVYAGDHLQP